MPLYRIVLYSAAFVAMVVTPAVYLATIFGGLEPKLAADLAAIFVLIGVYTISFSPLLAKPGEGLEDRDAKWDKICTVWLWTSGIVHLSWELSWCIAHPFLHGVTGEDTWAFLWWAYGIADTRYLESDSFVVPMEWVTSVVGGPLAIYAAVLIKRGKLMAANILVIIVSSMEGYGTILYWTTEWANGWNSVDMGDFNNWWIKFWGLNSAWVVLPVISIVVAWRTINNEFKRASAGASPEEDPPEQEHATS